MKKITVKRYSTYKMIGKIFSVIVAFVLILILLTLFYMMYKGVENKNYTTFSYALLVANAIVANALFAFGRSPVFMEKNGEKEKEFIYFSATMFLCAALIGFLAAGWVYVNTDSSFFGNEPFQKSYIGSQIIRISLAVVLGISIIFSILGFFFFGRWVKKVIAYFDKKMDEKEKIEQI